MVLGEVNFKTIGLKQYFSRVEDSVSAARHQPGTVQKSADSQMLVVVRSPLFDEKSFGQHFGLERSSNLGHDYGLKRSLKRFLHVELSAGFLQLILQNAVFLFCLTGS